MCSQLVLKPNKNVRSKYLPLFETSSFPAIVSHHLKIKASQRLPTHAKKLLPTVNNSLRIEFWKLKKDRFKKCGAMFINGFRKRVSMY